VQTHPQNTQQPIDLIANLNHANNVEVATQQFSGTQSDKQSKNGKLSEHQNIVQQQPQQ
jgi:hypothetical protein